MPTGRSAQPGTGESLREQSDAGHAMEERHMATVDELQKQLAEGSMTQDQYFQRIGDLFDQELANLQGDLGEQGNESAAAGVPVGIGQVSGLAQQRFENKLAQRNAAQAPIAGPVGGPAAPGGKLPPLQGRDELLFGPTSRPMEDPSTGQNRVTPGKAPMAAEIRRVLPYLARLAQEPGAPPQLVLLVNLLAQQGDT